MFDSIYSRLFNRKYYLNPNEYSSVFVDRDNWYSLKVDLVNKYIVAAIICSRSFYNYEAWVHLKQEDYDLLVQNKENFVKWINYNRQKGREPHSDQVVQYVPKSKKNFIRSKPECIQNLDFGFLNTILTMQQKKT